MEGTEGTETSQYLEEEKTTCDSRSSGERNGKSLNRVRVIACKRCVQGVEGLLGDSCRDPRQSEKDTIGERHGKAGQSG